MVTCILLSLSPSRSLFMSSLPSMLAVPFFYHPLHRILSLLIFLQLVDIKGDIRHLSERIASLEEEKTSYDVSLEAKANTDRDLLQGTRGCDGGVGSAETRGEGSMLFIDASHHLFRSDS